VAELRVKFDETTEGADYHAVSPAAVGSLVMGLLSPLALVGLLLWIIPAVGVGLAVLAFRAIRQSNGGLTGTGTAYAGLALCTIFAAAGPVQTAYTTHYLAQASRPMVEAWFDFLRHGEPQKALQLTVPPLQRRVLNDLLWDYYGSSKENREELENFVASPVPRLVLEYGEKCQVRFYEVGRVTTGPTNDMIELVYAVTYPGATGKRTFFVYLTVDRRPLQTGEISWRIANYVGGYRPTSMAE
jgi:hypothetical protein